jgi:hypothetical protein
MSKRLVLTAGHCGCGKNYRITQNLDMKGAKFIPAEGSPVLLDPQACQLLPAVRPGYDLALLHLGEDAEVANTYQAFPKLAFDLIDHTRRGAGLVVVGYGLTEILSKGTRMEASVPVFTTDCAQRQYVAAGCAPFFEMILAANGTGGRRTDTCSGDSGGPVFAMVPMPGLQPEPSLVAVTSRPAPLQQLDTQNHCGGGGIYTVVGRRDVRNWLAHNGASGSPQ